MKNNSKLGLWLIVPAFVLAFAARMEQICGGTDMFTGFLKKENGFFMDYGFWLVILITIAASVAAWFFDKKKNASYCYSPVKQITDSRAVAIGFAMLLPAMAALYMGYAEAVIPEESNISPSPFMMVVNFLFGGIMLVIAFAILYFKEFKPLLGFSMSVAAVYYTLSAMGIFLEVMAITTVPEYLINCISMIFAALFFMQLAVLLSGNEGKHTRLFVSVTGTATAVTIFANSFSVICSALIAPAEVSTRIVSSKEQAEMLYQLAKGDNAYFMSFAPVSAVAAGIFAVVTLVVLYMKPSADHTASEAA